MQSNNEEKKCTLCNGTGDDPRSNGEILPCQCISRKQKEPNGSNSPVIPDNSSDKGILNNSEGKITLLLVKGVEGFAIYLNDYRIAGAKPWGGGSTLKSWEIKLDDLKRALPNLLP